MVPSDLRSRAARLCRLRHDPQLLFPAPAPPPLNRRDHLDCRHRAMPIVTISIALGAHSAEKQGSHQRTLTLKLKEMEVDMRGAENDEPEMSFRRGYQQGAIDIFLAIERCLDPTTREVLQAWIEKDVSMWRAKAMLGHPPNWRLNMIAGPRSA